MKKKFAFVATYIQKNEGMPEKKKTIRGLITAPDANTAADLAQTILSEEKATAVTIDKVNPSPIREIFVDAEADATTLIEVTVRGEIKDENMDKAVITNYQLLFDVSGFSRVIQEITQRFTGVIIRQMKLSNIDWFQADVTVE